jgi:hypothetical protein
MKVQAMFSSSALRVDVVASQQLAGDVACSSEAALSSVLARQGKHEAGGNNNLDFFDGPNSKRPRLENFTPSCGLPAPSSTKARVTEPPVQRDINDIWDKVPRDVWGLILEKLRKEDAATLALVRRGPQEAFSDPATLHRHGHFIWTYWKIAWGAIETAPLEFFREPRNQATLSFARSVAIGGPKWLRPDLPELYDILAMGTPRLKMLSLHKCYHLSPRDHFPINRFTQLTRLEIPGTARHLDDDLMSIIGTMTGLRSLELKNENKQRCWSSDDFVSPDDARRSVITAAGVAGLKGLTSLERLNLSGHFLPARCTRFLLELKSLRFLGALHWQGFTAHQIQNLLHQMPALSWVMFSMVFSEKADPSVLWYASVNIRDRKLMWCEDTYKNYGMRVSKIKKTKLALDNVEEGDDPSLVSRMSARDAMSAPSREC